MIMTSSWPVTLRRASVGTAQKSGCASYHRRLSSSFAELKHEMTSRKLPVVTDRLTEIPTLQLQLSLHDFLSPGPGTGLLDPLGNPNNDMITKSLLPGHHLVYFAPQTTLNSLLPDGTDPLQSPGVPFVRRMWAGGRLSFYRPIPLSNVGLPIFCFEKIRSVDPKGQEGEEKLFVSIERRFHFGNFGYNSATPKYVGYEAVRNNLYRDDPADPGSCDVIENRTLVFMRERNPEVACKTAKARDRIVKPPQNPMFSHTLTPTAALLFRFSALTFNAHSIHLNPSYCREVEGHRDLLVHGPLSLVLMLEVLERYWTQEAGNWSRPRLGGFEYRNLAPLYAGEKMTVCGKRGKAKGEWELWIEGKDGGLAVRGLAKEAKGPS